MFYFRICFGLFYFDFRVDVAFDVGCDLSFGIGVYVEFDVDFAFAFHLEFVFDFDLCEHVAFDVDLCFDIELLFVVNVGVDSFQSWFYFDVDFVVCVFGLDVEFDWARMMFWFSF